MANSGSNDLHQVMAQLRRLGGEGDSLAALWQHRKTALENSIISKEIIQQLAWAVDIDKKCANRQLVMDSELSHLLVQAYKEIHGALASYTLSQDGKNISHTLGEILGRVLGGCNNNLFSNLFSENSFTREPEPTLVEKEKLSDHPDVNNEKIEISENKCIWISGVSYGDVTVAKAGTLKLTGVLNGETFLDKGAKLVNEGVVRGNVLLYSPDQIEGDGVFKGKTVILSY